MPAPTKPSRRSRGSVTIEDVARAAGVSAMTVSRVINKEPNVRDETRQNVLETIERMNYSPNTAARNLAAGEATHIGLLYSNPSAAYLSQFLVGALEAARESGCHLVIEACSSTSEAEQREVARRFAQADAEGVILPPPLSESVPILSELEAAGTPIVTVAMGQLHPNALNVRIDDYAAAKEMTEYLIGLGHKRIGLIRGHPDQIASAERERGFMQPPDALLQRGFESLPTLGDGRQSGTSDSPSILNASPESAAGGGLSWLRTGDTIRIDLNAGTCDALVADDEIAGRKAEAPPPIPKSNTPWEELYREKTGQLSTGGVLEFAVKYRGTSAKTPRHNH